MKDIDNLFKESDLGIVILSELGDVISANAIFKQWLGTDEPLTSTKLMQSFKTLEIHIKKLKSASDLKHLKCNLELHRIGLARPLEIQGLLIANKQEGSNVSYGLICWPNDDVKLTTTESPSSKLNELILNIPTGIITLNKEWECDFINPEFSILTEKSDNELYGKGWLGLFKNESGQLAKLINDATKYGVSRTELTLNSIGKPTKTLEFKFKARLSDNGLFESGFGALIDISDRVIHEAKIYKLANYDSITNLPNRRATQENLSKYLQNAVQTNQSLQLLYINLDGFRGINDLYGHQIGDKILQGVSERIINLTRSSDVVSRFGGDEFIILVPGNATDDDVDELAEAIIAEINTPFYFDELQLHISASIGIAKFKPDLQKTNFPENYVQLMVKDLIQRADLTVYCAKQAGKNQYIRFSNDKTQKVTELYHILQKLPSAIENNLFTMMYQPIIDAQTGKLTAVEALIRWYDKDTQWIAPDQFIPIAETHGKILSVQQCMINKVCQDISTTLNHFAMSENHIRITINLSPVQLADPKGLLIFLSNIQRRGIKPNQITLEITEHMLVEETPALIKCLTNLESQGFTIALDDFGTGYSSLSYLATVPMSTIKLDKSFVDTIETSASQKALVKGVIFLAKSLKLKVVAEGVENKAQMDILTELGCDYIQGYLIAKPMKPEALIKWLENKDG